MLAITQQAQSPNFREVVEESRMFGMRGAKHTLMQSCLKEAQSHALATHRASPKSTRCRILHGHQNALVMAPVNDLSTKFMQDTLAGWRGQMHSAQVTSVENIPQQRQLAGICKIKRQDRTTSAARDSRGRFPCMSRSQIS